MVLWVEMEVNSKAVKHMIDLTWRVDEVDNTSLTHLYGYYLL